MRCCALSCVGSPSAMVRELFTLAHLNARSLLSNYEHFTDFCEGKGYDIIAVTETWLSEYIDTRDIVLVGYRVFRRDRLGRGGGVAFFVRDNLIVTVLDASNTIEQLWISLKLNGVSFAVGVLYRPPSFDYNTFLDELESRLSEVVLR